MVGLVVTPTTDLESSSRCRSPLRSSSRDRSSSQMETPCSDSWASASVMRVLPDAGGWWGSGGGSGRGVARAGGGGCARRLVPAGAHGAGARVGDALAGRGGDRLGGDAELPVDRLVVGGGAEVLQRDDPAGVADDLTP